MQKELIKKAALLAVVLALFVVMLGAYTRLTDAGLGCPDWPGCYGRMVLPSAHTALHEAQARFPQVPIESRKAWTEMAHRYAAGTLVLLLCFIAVSVARARYAGEKLPWHLPVVLLLLVAFQAALGMWTVTLKLLPVVVMGHLLGGMLVFACLCRFYIQLRCNEPGASSQWRPWLRLGLVIVFLQIALGGWVSSNYAGISCIGFPRCNGLWFPTLQFAEGFNLFSPVGANYQGGLLDSDARMSIQVVHRIGAVLTALYISILALFMLWRAQTPCLRRAALFLLTLVLLQFGLGIMNVVYLLPIGVAVAHNGVAALLLATVFSLLHVARKEAKDGD
jgi:cytochrome c oxidase assembly protein subunit 15